MRVARVVRRGLAAAALGVAAGLTEIVVGTHRWLGAKDDPTTLGVVTVGLAVLVGGATLVGRRPEAETRVGAGLVLLAAAAVGTTTAGAAWVPTAALAVITGWQYLQSTRTLGSSGRPPASWWPVVLPAVLAVVPLVFGVVAGGWLGAVGVAGAAAVVLGLRLRRRRPRVAAALLVAGAGPFAVLTWWTAVMPLTAVLIVGLGLLQCRFAGEGPRSPGEPDAGPMNPV